MEQAYWLSWSQTPPDGPTVPPPPCPRTPLLLRGDGETDLSTSSLSCAEMELLMLSGGLLLALILALVSAYWLCPGALLKAYNW